MLVWTVTCIVVRLSAHTACQSLLTATGETSSNVGLGRLGSIVCQTYTFENLLDANCSTGV